MFGYWWEVFTGVRFRLAHWARRHHTYTRYHGWSNKSVKCKTCGATSREY